MVTKVSKRNEHDWVMVTAKFDSGAEAKVKWNRAGSTVTVTPRDPVQANRLSLIVDRAQKLPNVKIGDIADIIERVSLGSQTLYDAINGISATLGVSGELSVSGKAPDNTTVTLKQGRGFVLSGTFQSGERFELKINKSSVGLKTDPMISSRDDELMKMVFGVKHSGLMSDADLAEALKTEALSSPGFDQWIEKARNMLRAGPRP